MYNAKKFKALKITLCVLLFIVWIFCSITGTKLNVIIHNEKLISLGNFIDKYIVLKYFIKFITYYFNLILIIYTILNRPLFIGYSIKISIYIISIWSLKTVFENYTFSALFDFLYIILILFIDRTKWLKSIIELIKAFIFSLICYKIKDYNHIYINDLPTIIAIIMMTDYYILFGINYLYSRKEVDEDVTMGNFLWKTKKMESIKCSISNIISRCNSNYYRIISSLKANSWKIYCSIIFAIITYRSIFIISFFFNKIIEITICVICFHIFRLFDNKTYHANTSLKCFIISCIAFSILIKFSPPLVNSIFATILLSYVLTKIMYGIEDYIQLLREKDLNKKVSRLENLTIIELKEIFSEYSDNDIRAIYTCLHKNRNVTYENIALKYNMSRMTLYRIMKNIKNKYNDLLIHKL